MRVWHHGVWVPSEHFHKMRLKFEKLLRECYARPSIDKLNLGHTVVKYAAIYTSLIPNSKVVARMQRLLHEDNEIRDPHLKWSRETCLTALASRGIMLPNQDTMTRSECRLALEEADKNDFFPFMALPREVRNSIYRHAGHQSNVIKKAPTVTSPLLHTSKQVREEAQPIFFSINRFQLRTRVLEIPRCINKNEYIITYVIALSLQDEAWLRHIGPANVAKLRYVTITTRDGSIDWPNALHVDLACRNVQKWSRTFPGRNESDESDELHHEPLSAVVESRARWTEELKAEAEADESDSDKLQKAQLHKRRHERIQAYISKAQWEMFGFRKNCGEGKTVAPTIDGLALVASVVAETVKKMDHMDCLQ
jgi:hypothetical protein